MAKKLTPKQRVLKKYPHAYLWRWQSVTFYGVEIDTPSQRTLGQGTSPAQAWREAAMSISSTRMKP
jgi:hypothetical protein